MTRITFGDLFKVEAIGIPYFKILDESRIRYIVLLNNEVI